MTKPLDRRNPYVGPRTFTRQEKDLFFGREREARALLSKVMSARLVLFYAPSGAGKSSLINTRLIPQLDDEDFMKNPGETLKIPIKERVSGEGEVELELEITRKPYSS